MKFDFACFPETFCLSRLLTSVDWAVRPLSPLSALRKSKQRDCVRLVVLSRAPR